MSKAKVGMVVLSDTGLRKDLNTVIWNDLVNLQKIIEFDGKLQCRIYFRDEVDKALNADILFILYGGLISFGGVQAKNAASVISLANRFNGPVIFFGNDVLSRYDNRQRDGFVRFERPVYFANPSGGATLNVEAKGLEVAGMFELNEAFMIGKKLAQMPNVDAKPKYDVVYGTRYRPPLMKRLNYLSKHCKMLTFGNINKKIKNTEKLKVKMTFNNAEMRVINSLGKYSLMLHEVHKDYFTNRIFEQLASNSIVLFDRDWSTYKMFWKDDNVFDGSMKDCLRLIKQPYSKERVQRQHEMLRAFDFDSYIEKECRSVESVLEA